MAKEIGKYYECSFKYWCNWKIGVEGEFRCCHPNVTRVGCEFKRVIIVDKPARRIIRELWS